MEKQAFALVLYAQAGPEGYYGCEDFDDAYQMKLEGTVKKILWSSYNPEQVMKAAHDANKTCAEQGVVCFDSDREALMENKIQLSENELRNLVKESVKQVLKEVLDTFGAARDAYKASCERGDWGKKPDFANKLYGRMQDLAPQNFDPNIDVIVVGGDGQGEYKAGDLEQYFEVTGYVEPSPNSIYNNSKLIGAPKIKGYLGPMWDGGRYRYETPEVYRTLSM